MRLIVATVLAALSLGVSAASANHHVGPWCTPLWCVYPH